MKKKQIYLDYAATTPVDPEVFAAMKPYFSEKFGNAMSIHSFGQTALEAVDKARKQTADFLGCLPSEIIFTSGATESNNLAINGVLKAYYSKFNPPAGGKPHIITTAFEHHCVLDACKSAEKEGLAKITYLKPDKNGLIRLSDVKKALTPDTILVSIMYVNNEIGTVQPIAEIGKIIKKVRGSKSAVHGLYPVFHTDATQAVNYFDCNIEKLGADLLSMSAHKIYGPKGIGALYIRKGTPVRKIQDGGDQEYKMRAGTHNVPGIVGLGKALEIVSDPRSKIHRQNISKLRDYLIKKVLKEISKSSLNGSKTKRSPHNANFSFAGVEGEGLLLSLDMEGIACSTGSACSSGALSPSHVLLSMGLSAEQAHGSLRLTIGKYTTRPDVEKTVKEIKVIVARLRKISGNVLRDFYGKK